MVCVHSQWDYIQDQTDGQQTYGCGLMRPHYVILLNDPMHKRTNIVVAFLSHRLYYVIMPHGLLHKHISAEVRFTASIIMIFYEIKD